MELRIRNPIFGDTVTVMKTGKETNDTYTLFEVYIPAGKQGPPPHYHKNFTEHFNVIDGKLHILKNKQKMVLLAGEDILIERNVLHGFWTEDSDAKFTCKTEPAHDGQIEAMKIAANLAKSGKLNSKGIPKNIWHMAALFDFSKSNLPGFYSFMEKILKHMVKTDKGQRVQKELISHYSSWS